MSNLESILSTNNHAQLQNHLMNEAQSATIIAAAVQAHNTTNGSSANTSPATSNSSSILDTSKVEEIPAKEPDLSKKPKKSALKSQPQPVVAPKEQLYHPFEGDNGDDDDSNDDGDYADCNDVNTNAANTTNSNSGTQTWVITE